MTQPPPPHPHPFLSEGSLVSWERGAAFLRLPFYLVDPVGLHLANPFSDLQTGTALTDRPNSQVLAGDRSNVWVIPTVDNPCFLWTSGAGLIWLTAFPLR